MKKSLVLGASGFLGKTLCNTLWEAGESVRGFSRTKPKERHPCFDNIEWHLGDFESPENLRQAVRGCNCVYHLISTTTPRSSNRMPIMDCQSNIISSLRLIEISLEEQVEKIVYLSSGGTVYGPTDFLPIIETSSTNPISAYGVSKLAIEKYLHMYSVQYGLNYNILRISNPYGEYQSLKGVQGAIGIFMGKVIKGNPIEIWGDGNIVRDYVYAKDVAEAIYKSSSYDGVERVFNIGSGTGHSLKDIVGIIEEITNRNVPITYQLSKQQDVPENVLDIDLALQHLQWSPSTSLKEGISKVFLYHEKSLQYA